MIKFPTEPDCRIKTAISTPHGWLVCSGNGEKVPGKPRPICNLELFTLDGKKELIAKGLFITYWDYKNSTIVCLGTINSHVYWKVGGGITHNPEEAWVCNFTGEFARTIIGNNFYGKIIKHLAGIKYGFAIIQYKPQYKCLIVARKKRVISVYYSYDKTTILFETKKYTAIMDNPLI